KISESLLVVAPYLDSNSSGIVLKTMAYQTPLITTSVGSIPEYVKNSAILVPPRDENKLAEGMLSLLINKNKRENLAIEARQRIEKNYTWNKIAMQTHHLYEQVMLQ
ncbi:MAG: glycosyltransferase, partial [Candidatus Bathyarchaeota archaeon]